MSLHLMRPEYLWALLPAAVLGLLLWRQRGQSGNWSTVIAPQLLPYLVGSDSGVRRRNLTPGLMLAWLLAVFAASGPSWQKIPQPVYQTQDALVLVLDLSYSMTAADLPPARIDRARQKLLDLLQQRKEGQTGLVAYAGDAHIVTPLTDDTPTIANLLPALHPSIMPLPGSEPATAVQQAVELLRSAGIRQGKILLLTDGITAPDREELASTLKGSGMQLSIMGIGTATGAPIPLPRGGFFKDENGTIVMPGLRESELRGAAGDVGGRYMRMQIDDSDLDYLLAANGLNLPQQTLALDRSADAWEDQGYLLVLALLPLALVLFRRGWVVCLLPILFLPQAQPAQAGLWDDLWLTRDQQGQRALQQQDNEAAAQLFDNNDWAGTAAYRSEDYESAVQKFSSNENADSWYNRGNALARAGKLEEAIEAYQQSLALDDTGEDARANLELLEQLKQEQQQQQQPSDEQQQDQDGEQQQEQQDSDSQQQDGQQQQSQEQSQSGDSPQNQPDQSQPEPGEQQQEETEPHPAKSEHPPGEQQQAQATAGEASDKEREQAMEQWLRRVPDDPSGLLREKFRYESQQRQQQGMKKDDETYW